ncbi:hypothetical protein LB503_011254, partial [Fusarium chuoi]
ITRFVHTSASGSGGVEKGDVEADEFSEGEEFERDAVEWFDQQDRLVLPTTETISKGTQIASGTDGDLVEASKREKALTESTTQSTPIFGIQPGRVRLAPASRSGPTKCIAKFKKMARSRKLKSTTALQNIRWNMFVKGTFLTRKSLASIWSGLLRGVLPAPTLDEMFRSSRSLAPVV